MKDNKIPRDLIIKLTFSSTIQFSSEYDLKITSDGKVYLTDRSHNLPSGTSFYNLLGLSAGKNKIKKTETPKLKDKLSKKQIKQIIGEFERSGFFEMNDYYQGDPTLTEMSCINHANTKGLSISANGKTKNVAFFLGCSYSEKSPLKDFLSLYDKIDKVLSGVKKISPEVQQTIKSSD
ncbi:MAG: hypothetical protein ABJA66_07180 [Actinomycetota bacterium]